MEAGGQLGGRREVGNLGQGGGAGLEGGGWSQKVPVTRTQQDLGMRGLWAEWKRHFKNMPQVSRCLVSSVVSEPYLARLHIEYGGKKSKDRGQLGHVSVPRDLPTSCRKSGDTSEPSPDATRRSRWRPSRRVKNLPRELALRRGSCWRWGRTQCLRSRGRVTKPPPPPPDVRGHGLTQGQGSAFGVCTSDPKHWEGPPGFSPWPGSPSQGLLLSRRSQIENMDPGTKPPAFP